MKISSHLCLLVVLLLAGWSTPSSGKEKKWQRTINLKTQSPLDQVVEVGGTAKFAVTTKADETTYQWLFGCDAIPGATNNVLTVWPVSTNNAGYYTCVAYRGLDMSTSEPLQLISLQRINTDTIVLGAKPPPGLGGISILPEQMYAPRRPRQSASKISEPSFEMSARAAAAPQGAAPALTGGLPWLSQMTLLMLDITNSLPYVGYVSGTGCPRPYSGYVRNTLGWNPIAGAPWRATALWSPCSAIVFDDRYRSGCDATSDFNLTLVSPSLVTTRLHRFVAYFPPASPPNQNTTYLLRLTGFQ
jgi:hypothetical protein